MCASDLCVWMLPIYGCAARDVSVCNAAARDVCACNVMYGCVHVMYGYAVSACRHLPAPYMRRNSKGMGGRVSQ